MVVVYSSSDRFEGHATSEFVNYVSAMTGLKPIVFEDDEVSLVKDPSNLAVSIGDNVLTRSLVEKGLLNVSKEELGEEGFIIKSVTTDDRDYLILLGGSPRATLYAVYHYLENYCKIGFFWDGEHIPKHRCIPHEGIDATIKPHFKLREYLSACAWTYTCEFWDWSDWKKEIDWTAKKKLNIIWAPMPESFVYERVWQKMGISEVGHVSPDTVGLEEPLELVHYKNGLSKKIFDYARELGIKCMYREFLGRVPPEFRKTYPESRYFEVKWGSWTNIHIHPSDPIFKKLLEMYLNECIKLCGTNHIYFAHAYGETKPGNTPEEAEEIKINFAKTISQTIKSVDPEGIIWLDGWTFNIRYRKYWPKNSIKSFLEAIPNDMVVCWDSQCDLNPLYEELDYFWGKNWIFGVIHAFGGHTHLHGDLADIIERVKKVFRDTKADKCIGFGIWMEIIHHNHLYYDLVTRLAWDPKDVELESFLKDYAVRRYGEESADNMVECLRELAESVYRSNDQATPFYQFRLTDKVGRPPNIPRAVDLTDPKLRMRNRFIPHLQRALEIALKEAGRQMDNPLYRHDLIDITRQYLGELFNYRVVKLYDAFKRGNGEAFETQAKELNKILDSLEKILSTDDLYCLQPLIDKANKLPGAPAKYEQRAKDIVTTLTKTSGVINEGLIDYARRDAYELVKFYYRKRVEAYLEVLKRKIELGIKDISLDELRPIYSKIENKFVDETFHIEESERYAGTTIDAAKEVLKDHRIAGNELLNLTIKTEERIPFFELG